MNEPEAEATEARRQRELLAAFSASQRERALAPGLQAYRANAQASAVRALAAAFPTVQALLGEADFAQLAREFWQAHPPLRGDLGEWGDALPRWIAMHPGLAEWPYLEDCARLDLALHRCERAADAAFDAATLAQLSSADPSRLLLRLMPGVQALGSRWPLASLHAAHAANDERLFDAARERMQAAQGEAVVVARAGWRAVVHRIDAPGLAFMQALAAGLSSALDAAGNGFDFAAWLGEALCKHWLKDVVLAGDRWPHSIRSPSMRTTSLTNPLARCWVWAERAIGLLERLQPAAQLLARVYIASVFFRSGLTKLRDWETTLALFQDEYHVPLLDPTLAAWLGTAAELALPLLLLFGLGGRFAAAGLFVLNIIAVLSLTDIADAALQQHVFWGSLLAGLLLWGPGRWSLDSVIVPRLRTAVLGPAAALAVRTA